MNIYHGLEARLYDRFFVEEDLNDFPLYAYFLEKIGGSSLEIGCGSGRLLLPLLEFGINISGLDASKEMLNLCREQLKERELKTELYEQKMQELSITNQCFDVVTIPTFSLQLVSRENASKTLAKIHKHMPQGGTLILSTYIPQQELSGDLPENEWLLDREVIDDDEGYVIRHHRKFEILKAHQCLTIANRWELKDASGVQEDTSETVLCWYTKEELEDLLKRSGFALLNAYADFEEMESGEDDLTTTFVAAAS